MDGYLLIQTNKTNYSNSARVFKVSMELKVIGKMPYLMHSGTSAL
jgi:uncharacterized membrane protein